VGSSCFVGPAKEYTGSLDADSGFAGWLWSTPSGALQVVESEEDFSQSNRKSQTLRRKTPGCMPE
jgi:hypothetical protein